MKKLILMVCLCLGLVGCNSVGDNAKFLECLARDRTSNPCH